MTLGEWLRSREPQPPAALLSRLERQLADSLYADASRAPEVCLAAGERLVASLIASRETTRESALDLLAADALVTYAFEAASTCPMHVERDAAAAMARIAVLGASGE